MTYSFVCPLPCTYEVKVHANSKDDAVNAILKAGAISCRNMEKQCRCEEARIEMPPFTNEQLRVVVRLCMEEEFDIVTHPAAGGIARKSG